MIRLSKHQGWSRQGRFLFVGIAERLFRFVRPGATPDGRDRSFGIFVEGTMEPFIPVLNQCFLCKRWSLEEDLQTILIPDQVGHTRKLACGGCLAPILKTLQEREKGTERDQAMQTAWSNRRMENNGERR